MRGINCPNCGLLLTTEGKQYGDKIQCGSCGVSISISKAVEVFEKQITRTMESSIDEKAIRKDDSRRRTRLKKNWMPLREWVTYFVILSFIILVTIRGNLIAAVATDSTGLTLFIVLIFFMSLAKSAYDVCYINREFELAQEQIELLWKTTKVGNFLQSAKNSLFRDHIQNLYRIYRQDSEVSQNNLIEILQVRLSSRTKVVDLSSSILTTLGLIGTIIGLVMSVNGIQQMTGEIGTGDGGGLLEKMSETLSGMGVAFYTTLMGAILGGIILRVLTASVQGSQDHLVAHIAELSEVYILPRLRKHARSRDIQDED